MAYAQSAGQVNGKRCQNIAVPVQAHIYSQTPNLLRAIGVSRPPAFTYTHLPLPKYKMSGPQTYSFTITKFRQSWLWKPVSKGLTIVGNNVQNIWACSMTHLTNTFGTNKKELTTRTTSTQRLSVLPTNDDYQQKKFEINSGTSLPKAQEPTETNPLPQDKNADDVTSGSEHTPSEPLSKLLPSDLPVSILNGQPQNQQHPSVPSTLRENLQEQTSSEQPSTTLSETRQADTHDELQDGPLVSTSEGVQSPLLGNQNVTSANLKKDIDGLQEITPLQTSREEQQQKPCSFEEIVDTKPQTEQVKIPFSEEQNGQAAKSLKTGQDITSTADNNLLGGEMMKKTQPSIQIKTISSRSFEIRYKDNSIQIIEKTVQESEVVLTTSKTDLVLESPKPDPATETLEKLLHTVEVSDLLSKPTIGNVLHADLPPVSSLTQTLVDAVSKGIPVPLHCEEHLPKTSLSGRLKENKRSTLENKENLVSCGTY